MLSLGGVLQCVYGHVKLRRCVAMCCNVFISGWFLPGSTAEAAPAGPIILIALIRLSSPYFALELLYKYTIDYTQIQIHTHTHKYKIFLCGIIIVELYHCPWARSILSDVKSDASAVSEFSTEIWDACHSYHNFWQRTGVETLPSFLQQKFGQQREWQLPIVSHKVQDKDILGSHSKQT